MGRQHARAAAAAGASIVGIVDRDLVEAQSLARRWPKAEAWAELSEALKASNFGVAHICTPVATHQAIARTVADAGLHALIEKPMAESAKEARSIHACFQRAGRFACPTHQYAFQRSVRTAAARLPSLGRLRRIDFDICSAGAAAGQMSPDGLVAEILPHPLSILQKLLPSIDLAELDWTCIRAAAGEWHIAATWHEAHLTMRLSAAGRPTRFLTRITAERGSIDIDHFHDFAVVLPGTVSKAQKIMAPITRSSREFATASWNLLARAARREFAYPGLKSLVEAFYAAVGDPRHASPISPEDSIAVAQSRDQIIRRAIRG
jgi:predicted dehydrogenase